MSAPAETVERLLELVGCSWRTQAIHAMVVLGVADALASGPLEGDALARAVGAHHGALQRLLRGLALLDLVRASDGAYELTAMGRLLCTQDREHSLADWVSWWAGRSWAAWGMLPEAVRNGAPVRAQVHGRAGYAIHENSPQAAETFHAAMAALSALAAPQVLSALAQDCSHVVDVGGGYGELLAHLLRARPHLHGTLLEQQHALAGARRHLEAAGVAARCTLTAGDFFATVPTGADAYLLKSVLHNWGDEAAACLLHHCCEAMTPNSQLLIVERLLDSVCPTDAQVRTDLNMLVGLGGRERTITELIALGRKCGLVLLRLHTGASHSVLAMGRA